ncbi:HPP family protein [Carboxydothermus pertinax]|uniref:HPP family protein n=1 Tax=Carboxydothermus pertinax TaxID=870242 RepID=A0A1L8CS72_9THEO|nr:HPP family protein [Carboxydothermus pertinax]GAV21762.1 HPP family protein [Carboxydothermus pertinax]
MITFLAYTYNLPLLLPSLGASAVILFGAWESPFARPKSVLGGHIISATVGVLIAHLAGSTWWSIALGVTLAIGAMIHFKSLHPPGGATAFMAVYNNPNWEFILTPVAIGAILLLLIAALVKKLEVKSGKKFFQKSLLPCKKFVRN